MSEVYIYPFMRMNDFLELSRISYVGPRIFPQAAFVYAALQMNSLQETTTGKIFTTPTNISTFLRIREFVGEFVNDRYYMDMETYNRWDEALDVPREIRSRAFGEIATGGMLLSHIAIDRAGDICANPNRYKVIPDIQRNSLTVMRR